MPHVRDSNSEDAARENFAVWLQGVLTIQRAKGRSKSGVAELTGINRNTIDRWLKKEVWPGPENVRKFCDALGLDYGEPSRLLGWNSDSPFHMGGSDLGDSIRRAKMLAEDPRTSDRRRRQLEQQIAAAESMRQSAAAQRLTAEQMERSAETLLREAIEDPEDAND